MKQRRSAKDGSVQGFAGRARASPVNQDGWLNLQRSRNKHKTNGGDRFLEYNNLQRQPVLAPY